MKVESKEVNGIKVLTFTGQVRISTQNEFKDILDQLLVTDNGMNVVLNMEGVLFMNSIALGIIIDTYKKLKDHQRKMVLCSLVPDIMNLFEVTRLNRFIDIYRNESEALTRLVAV